MPSSGASHTSLVEMVRGPHLKTTAETDLGPTRLPEARRSNSDHTRFFLY